MADNKDRVDYMASINKARSRKRKPPYATYAAIAAGCDGLIIEVHHNPELAICDGAQSLYPWQYDLLYKQIKQISPVVGKEII